MYIEQSVIESNQKINSTTFLIKVKAPAIASVSKPGQFCNIKVSENSFPLLRRPFSICDVTDESLYFLFDIHGEGTKILSLKKVGEELDLLGPLGNGFNYEEEFEYGVIVAGGLGIAPFPFLLRKLSNSKNVNVFIGAGSKEKIINYGVNNYSIATDNGSQGFHGTVVELLQSEIAKYPNGKTKIFGCGPNAMLSKLKELCVHKKYQCEISVECAMACGFGICQGCPVETENGQSYLLVCKDGPVFNVQDINL